MGVMKRNLLLGIVLLSLSASYAVAEVTVNEMTDPEHLYNAGYSQLMTEDVFMHKNRVAGNPIEPLYNGKSQNKFVRFCKKVYGYFDPAIDEEDRIHHNIKPSPSYSDL